jgi:hypothetical protein
VELLHSHTTTQSHWSSGSTVSFLPVGSSLHPRGAPTLLELVYLGGDVLLQYYTYSLNWSVLCE